MVHFVLRRKLNLHSHDDGGRALTPNYDQKACVQKKATVRESAPTQVYKSTHFPLDSMGAAA